MVRFVGVDVSSDTITLEFDYQASAEDLIMDIVKSKLGDHIQLKSFRKAVVELDEVLKEDTD